MTRAVVAIRKAHGRGRVVYRAWHCVDCGRPPVLRTFWHQPSKFMLWLGNARCHGHRIIYREKKVVEPT